MAIIRELPALPLTMIILLVIKKAIRSLNTSPYWQRFPQR